MNRQTRTTRSTGTVTVSMMDMDAKTGSQVSNQKQRRDFDHVSAFFGQNK
jgi:hypothetical protein